MTGADFILKTMSMLELKCFFTVPGAHIDPLIEATQFSDVQPVVCCHELAAGYMADGYSRANKKLGVVACIGGPGAGNLVTAVNTARIEKTPLLILTGDVPTSLNLHPAFQCAGEFGSNDERLYAAITKFSRRVSRAFDLPGLLAQAIREALLPPCGPAHLIIPYDVLKDTVAFDPVPCGFGSEKPSADDSFSSVFENLCGAILGEGKTVLWLGEAINTHLMSRLVLSLSEKFHLPVVTTYGAKGVISEAHPLCLGNFGYAGSLRANRALLSKDVETLLGFDVEQNERNTLNWNPLLYAEKKIILVNTLPGFIPDPQIETLMANPCDILSRLHHTLAGVCCSPNGRAGWIQSLVKLDCVEDARTDGDEGEISPVALMKVLRRELPPETLFYVDSGAHRIFAGTDWQALRPETFFSASVTAPTGWALAAGVGGKIGRPEPVVILTGDGCMQMHGIEIKTAVRYGIPVMVILCNNSGMGNIHRRFAKISSVMASHALITEVDWSAFARSLGAKVFDAGDETSVARAIRRFLKKPAVCLINARVPIHPRIPNEAYCRSAFA
jgi:acetolactate synthase-1/2/3 large subunit